jgi:hypothetical protein
MNLSRISLFVFVTAALAPLGARADLIVPARAACDGKKVGDACDGGICQSEGYECQAGACRQYGSQDECAKNGCSWVEELRCAPAPAPAASTPTAAPTATTSTTTPPATEAPQAAPPASCAASPASWASVALAGLLLLRRRRG